MARDDIPESERAREAGDRASADAENVAECPDLPEHLRGVRGGTCYSGRNCTGKVLSHRDAHNCKNSGGKSWRSPIDGTCYNL
jgi:hypothetical protein